MVPTVTVMLLGKLKSIKENNRRRKKIKQKRQIGKLRRNMVIRKNYSKSAKQIEEWNGFPW
jgi:hypothetical protein